MNLTEYLSRINSAHLNHDVNIENLKSLQSSHLLNIPWENFSLAQNDIVKMDLERIYKKVILGGRGGFCFELNQLFAWLLRQLGYELELISCRNFMITTQSYHPWSGHMAILVNLNGKTYLVDVGHSSSPRYPLEFILSKPQQSVIGHFRIEKGETLDSNENIFTLFRTVNDLNEESISWLKIYQFNILPRKIQDFEQMLEWAQTKECARVYNRSFCIKHDQDETLKMLFVYNLTKVFFKDGVEIKREESEISQVNLPETIQKEMNVKIAKDFKPRNIPL